VKSACLDSDFVEKMQNPANAYTRIPPDRRVSPISTNPDDIAAKTVREMTATAYGPHQAMGVFAIIGLSACTA
jgi:hypothetical protein